MLIKITGIENEKYLYGLQHLAEVFYEDCKLVYETDQKPDLQFFYERSQLDQNSLKITAYYQDFRKKSFQSKKYETELQLSSSTERRAYLKLFVKILSDLEGFTPAWGTLTGIRPTKLVHKLQGHLPADEWKNILVSDYLIAEEKVALMEKIVERQLEVIPDLYDLNREVSLYIGIPFCPTKCAYCTFPAYAIGSRQGEVKTYLDYLHEEIRAIGQLLYEQDLQVTTIYYGGGTPTSISAEQMDALYQVVASSIPNYDSVREITVEAGRPDTITLEKLGVLNKWKIDRISINPQSFTDETLAAIGRDHSVAEVIDKFTLSRQWGMKNINMDLIIGLPGETNEHFQDSLSQLKILAPESITVHTLSFKRASKMTRNREKYPVAGSQEINKMMASAQNFMKENGYDPYYLYRQKNILGNLENIGYSLPGQESLYNILIMEEVQTILGLGCGAASKFVNKDEGKISRQANPKQPRDYETSFDRHLKRKINLLRETFGEI